MKEVTVVIPNYKGEAYLRPCVESLLAGTGLEMDVIIVDNGSRDGCVEEVRRLYPQVECVCLDQNYGFCKAVNIGIRKAWPADREQARVATYIIENTQDAKAFLETLNDFVATFPDWSESYLRRGTYYAQHRGELGKDVDDCLRRATDDLDRAIELAERKSEAMFAKAQLVYQIALSDSTLQNPQWNANWAQVLLTETLSKNAMPTVPAVLLSPSHSSRVTEFSRYWLPCK